MIRPELTDAQAQAVLDVLDREVRVTGAQGAILYGPILAEIVRAAKAAEEAGSQAPEAGSPA